MFWDSLRDWAWIPNNLLSDRNYLAGIPHVSIFLCLSLRASSSEPVLCKTRNQLAIHAATNNAFLQIVPWKESRCRAVNVWKAFFVLDRDHVCPSARLELDLLKTHRIPSSADYIDSRYFQKRFCAFIKC